MIHTVSVVNSQHKMAEQASLIGLSLPIRLRTSWARITGRSTPKSIEASLAAACITHVFIEATSRYFGVGKMTMLQHVKLLVVLLWTSVIEALSDGFDNLKLPLHFHLMAGWLK